MALGIEYGVLDFYSGFLYLDLWVIFQVVGVFCTATGGPNRLGCKIHNIRCVECARQSDLH